MMEMAVRIAELQGEVRAGFATVEGAIAGMRADAGHLRTAVANQSAEIMDLRAKVSVLELEVVTQREVRLTDQRRTRLAVAAVGALPVVGVVVAALLRVWG